MFGLLPHLQVQVAELQSALHEPRVQAQGALEEQDGVARPPLALINAWCRVRVRHRVRVRVRVRVKGEC